MGSIVSLRDLRAALGRQAWLIILLSALGIAGALVFATSRPKSFEATAVVQIEPPQVAEGEGAVLSGGLTANGQLDLIQQRLLARDAVAALVDRFDLFSEVPSEAERVALMRGSVTVTKLMDPAQAWRPDAQPSGLSISVRLPDAALAAAVANALVETVVAEARGRAATVTAQTLDFHRAEEAEVRAALEAVEAEIAEVRAANVESLPEALPSQRERLTSLTEDRVAAEREILAFESSGVARLRDEEAERQRALLSEGREVILGALAETQAALDAAPDVERRLGALDRERSALEAELAVVIADRRDAETAQRLQDSEQASRFTVLETAVAPEEPISTSPRKLAAAGAAAAVLVALAVALAREAFNPVLRTATQMQRALGLEPLVVIPRLRTRGAALRRGLGLLSATALGAAVVAAAFLGRTGLEGLLDQLPRVLAQGGWQGG